MAILIGFESANSYVKALSSVNNEVDTYKNTLTRIHTKTNAMDVKQENYKKDVYEFEGDFYRVGLEPKGADQVSSSLDDIKRYKDDKYRTESIIAIYRQLERATNDVFKERVYAVTGVPSNHANVSGVVETIQKQIEGEHIVNGKRFVVEKVQVVEQGLSAYYDELLDEYGEPNGEFTHEIEGKDVVYIDLGHGSTDIQWIKDMIKHDSQYMRGISSVWEDLKTIASDKNADFKSDDKSVLHLEKTFQTTGEFPLYDLDVSKDRGKLLKEYAKDVLNALSKNGFKDREFDAVVFTGGGSIALRKYLEETIHEQYSTEGLRKRFRFMDDAQASNARGYLKYAYNYFSEVMGVNV